MTYFAVAPTRSEVRCITRTSLHEIRGGGKGFEGFVDVEFSGDVIDMKRPLRAELSFPIGRLKSGNALFDAEMHRWVGVSRNPNIRGIVRRVTAIDAPKGLYRVDGDLTFAAVTKKLDGEVTVTLVNPNTLIIEGERAFDVREWGIFPPTIRAVKMDPVVQVAVNIVALRAE